MPSSPSQAFDALLDEKRVDLLARFPDGEEELIQICAEDSDPTTMQRELRALVGVGALHPRATQRLLLLTRRSFPQRVPDEAIVQPAYGCMLATDQKPGRG